MKSNSKPPAAPQTAGSTREPGGGLLADPQFAAAIADASPDTIYVFDLQQLAPIYVNRNLAAELGYSVADANAPASEFLRRAMHPDDYEQLPQWVGRFSSLSDGEVISQVYRLQDNDGQWRWFHTRSRVFTRDASGTPTHIIGASRDITQAHETELRLIASEQRYRALVENADDSIVLSDMSGQPLFRNPAYYHSLGYVNGAHLAEDGLDRVHPDDRATIVTALDGVRETHQAQYFEYRVRHQNGSWRFRSERVVPIVEDEAKGAPVALLSIARDTTEQKRLERAMEQAAAGLAAKTGREFFSLLVAHLAQATESACAMVARMTGTLDTVETVAVSLDGATKYDFSYPLEGTPCAHVFGQTVCTYPHGVQNLFPTDHMLRDLGFESFAGAPLFRSDGAPSGVLVVLDRAPMSNPRLVESLLKIFANRAAAELERLDAARESTEQKDRMEVTLDAVGDGILSVNSEGIIDYVNSVAQEMIGKPRAALIGLHYSDELKLTDELGRRDVANPLATCLSEGRRSGWLVNYVLAQRQGKKSDVEVSATPLRNSADQVVGAVLAIHDISATTAMAKQLAYHAAHDALTGLVNRREFEHKLEQALQQAKRSGGEHVLCYLDLDQFKLVNDTCGHVAGDELLRQLSVLLRRRLSSADVLARLGGDEFGLLLFDRPIEEALTIVDGYRQVIREFRFAWEGRVFEIGVSMGVVRITAQSENVTSILSAADVACYAAKDLGRNRIHVFEVDDAELVRRRGEMHWTGDIVHALEAGRFTLYFQPIIPLNGDRSDIHVEFLLRMLDEENNIIPPGSFIPAAERYNLMPAVDKWVIRQVFKSLAPAFRDDEIDCAGGLFAINISGTSLSDDGFLDYVREQFQLYEIPPHRICFEITETAAISNLSKAMLFINALRELGCRFALDDFGSGLSSFTYLKTLPVDYLKIDGAFVRDMVDDPMDAAMVRAIQDIAHVMGIKTIAEFVERKQVFSALTKAGVDFAQGFFCSSPQPLTSLRVLKEALNV